MTARHFCRSCNPLPRLKTCLYVQRNVSIISPLLCCRKPCASMWPFMNERLPWRIVSVGGYFSQFLAPDYVCDTASVCISLSRSFIIVPDVVCCSCHMFVSSCIKQIIQVRTLPSFSSVIRTYVTQTRQGDDLAIKRVGPAFGSINNMWCFSQRHSESYITLL